MRFEPLEGHTRDDIDGFVVLDDTFFVLTVAVDLAVRMESFADDPDSDLVAGVVGLGGDRMIPAAWNSACLSELFPSFLRAFSRASFASTHETLWARINFLSMLLMLVCW